MSQEEQWRIQLWLGDHLIEEHIRLEGHGVEWALPRVP